MGLFPAFEAGTFDHIADTPEEEGGNLMFWAYTGDTSLTDGQKFVMYRHPSLWLTPPGGATNP